MFFKYVLTGKHKSIFEEWILLLVKQINEIITVMYAETNHRTGLVYTSAIYTDSNNVHIAHDSKILLYTMA
jgi:hypothetical protein